MNAPYNYKNNKESDSSMTHSKSGCLQYSLWILVFLIYPGSIHSVSAQQKQYTEHYLNLSFESQTPANYPYGWYIEGDYANSTVQVTKTPMALEGQHTVNVSVNGDEPTILYTPLPASIGCIRNIELTVSSKGEGDVQASGFFIIPGQGFDLLEPKTVSQDWTKIKYTKSTDGGCIKPSPLIGIYASGVGTAVFDDITIRINGKAYASTPTPSFTIKKDTIDALNSIAHPVTERGISFPTHSNGMAKLLSRKIIALGENSHGAAELFAFKQKLIATLIQGGARTFALEIPAAAADRVNEYISGLEVSRETMIGLLVYPAWQTKEMLFIIDWLRRYNTTAEEKIAFAGFDVQHPKIALEALGKRPLIASNSAFKTAYNDLITSFQTGDAADTLKKIILMRDMLPLEAKYERRYLRLFRRGILSDRQDLGGKSRDAYMADEVVILAKETPSQVILWADNTHVTKTDGGMGQFLSQTFGPDYVAVGFTFERGFYAAYGPKKRYAVELPFAGTHEAVLATANEKAYLIALNDVPHNHPLNARQSFRYIGSQPVKFNQFYPHILKDHFDIIGFVRQTDATHYVIEHAF